MVHRAECRGDGLGAGMSEDEVDELDDSAFDFEWDEVSQKTFRPIAQARHFYQRGLNKQAKLIEALKAECDAAERYISNKRQNQVVPGTYALLPDYDKSRAARLKLEEKE